MHLFACYKFAGARPSGKGHKDVNNPNRVSIGTRFFFMISQFSISTNCMFDINVFQIISRKPGLFRQRPITLKENKNQK